MATPTIELHTLSGADGSATYTSPSASHTIIAGVHYPLEVQYRSKEQPEDTYIEVNLRPHNGVAQVRERHIEEIVKRVLRSIVRGEETPRCALQVTLQIADAEQDESLPGGVKGGGQGESYLEVLAGAVNAAVVGCLDGGVQMRGLVAAVVVVVSRKGEVVVWPSLKQRKAAGSLHVFGFGRGGECLVMESEGSFEIEEWERAESAARTAVLGAGVAEDEDVDMDDDVQSLFGEIRKAVEARAAKDERRRGGG